MKKIYDIDISPIEIKQINNTIYKVFFRENIESLNTDKVSCDEYTILTENSTPEETETIEAFVEANKEILLSSAIEQDKIKSNQNKIEDMQTGLTNTDYKVLKNLENFMIGIPFEQDLSSICANRQLMRDSINNIQQDISDDDDLLSQAKQRKINEISLTSQSMIINGVEFNSKRYRLNTTDQINMSALSAMAQMGNKVPYHADGEICRIFEPEEMVQLAQTATNWIVYHTTYFNLLKHQILEYDNLEDVEKVYYGTKLKDEYQQIINTIISNGSTTTDTTESGGGTLNE
jgi:hypothetical protein|nr:MAG TPA: protein of unknown function (DUF4376) [Caudoviricetes sp.]